MRILKKPIEFEWDRGNIEKNWLKHKVTNKEVEESLNDRLLYTVFTFRGKKIRIISSRDVNKKEVHLYEKKTKTTKV